MRPINIVVVLCAGLAIASPVINRALHTKVVTTVVYEYVTVTATPPSVPSAISSMSTSTSVQELAAPQTTSQSVFESAPSVPVSLPTTEISSSVPETSTSESLPTHVTTVALVAPPSTTESPLPVPTTEAPPAVLPATSETSSAFVPTLSPVIAVDATAGLSVGTDYQSALLYHHNIHRRNHSSPDVVWDMNLASYASRIAKSCVYAHNTLGGGGYGQNIAAASYPSRTGYNATYLGSSAVTDLWYNSEFGNFLPSYYGLPGPAPGISGWDHFSQILWVASTSIGCATVLCDPGKIFAYPTWYTVCNYSPQGNIFGEYGVNIGSPLGHSTLGVI